MKIKAEGLFLTLRFRIIFGYGFVSTTLTDLYGHCSQEKVRFLVDFFPPPLLDRGMYFSPPPEIWVWISVVVVYHVTSVVIGHGLLKKF